MPNLRETLTSELEKIPGMEKVLVPEYPGFTSFAYQGKGIGHFDTDFEFDLKLTKSNIAREGLEHPKDSTKHPNRFRTKPNWIVLPFRTITDVREILRLVKVTTDHD